MSTAAGEFDQFFRDHHPRLVACAVALTGDRERAREAAQEALTRAYREWERVRRIELPGAWVRRVLINLLADEGRRLEREQRHAQRAAPALVAPAPDPAWTPLLRAIRELPERQRLAIVLHYLDDLPVLDVASVMGVSEGTVKTTLFKARVTLAAALAGEER